jgi:hypothetical protein
MGKRKVLLDPKSKHDARYEPRPRPQPGKHRRCQLSGALEESVHVQAYLGTTAGQEKSISCPPLISSATE